MGRLLLAAALAALVAVPGSTARTLAATWSGTWASDWGDMKLVQSGARVTGTYTHDSGRISGTLTGRVLSWSTNWNGTCAPRTARSP